MAHYKSTGENYREIAALCNIISAAKNSHTLIIYFSCKTKDCRKIRILPDEFPEQQKFINDIVKTIRMRRKRKQRLYDEMLETSAYPDGHTYIDFITYENRRLIYLKMLYIMERLILSDSDYILFR